MKRKTAQWWCVSLMLIAVGTFGIASGLQAAQVSFSSAVATADQNFGAGVAGTIDGNVSSHGWALHVPVEDPACLYPQSAVFTASAPVDMAELYIAMAHNLFNAGHNISEFQLSVTSDVVPGLGGNWTPLTPTSLGSTYPLTSMVMTADGHIRALNNVGACETYTIQATAPFSGITGFRIDAFPYDYNEYDTLPATIGRASNGNIVLSEFIVADQPIELNVAQGKPTTGQVAFGYPTANGVNGNINDFTHTGNVGAVYWQVDLVDAFHLDRVVLYNRQGAVPERLNGAVVKVLNSAGAPIFTSTPLAGSLLNYTFDNGGAGFDGARYIKVEHNNQYLSVGELMAITDDIPEASTNWAIGAPATASGALYGTMAAGRLTDGLFIGDAVVHPAAPTPEGFYYQIDLQADLLLEHIDIYNRTNCCPERLSDYRVEILDANQTVVWTADLYPDSTANSGVGGVDVLTAGTGTGAFAGRYIRISNQSGMDYNPQIAEVEVFGTMVPEPGAWLLALSAMASLALSVMRRR